MTNRYLVPFHPKRVPHYFTDVLVIGSGLAGLRGAVAADRSQSVLVTTKSKVDQSSSSWAQGGIAGVLAPEDSFAEHVDDTIAAGGGLCDREVVEVVIREAPERIRELISWGTNFDRQGEELVLTREGGHSHKRIVHANGDATGAEVMRSMTAYVRSLPNVEIWQNAFTLDLLTVEGACRGAIAWNPHHGKMFIWAKQTILASGGGGQLYRETTNPTVVTADGHAMAWRAGAELRDMEFMQFHPTVLYIAGSSRSLITEAMRGEGAKLIDRDGRRFMTDYDDRLELAPRDVVSQAITSQMEKTRHPNVYLDLSHLDPEFVRRRFPGIAAACAKFGIDIAVDPIPVRPGAHYMIGGLTVDLEGRTTLPGLWAAGEVTSTGLHGANRLASNSLLEALVFGARAGAGASNSASQIADNFRAVPLDNPPVGDPTTALDVEDIRNSLKSLMWRNVGVRRDGERLAEAARDIEHWARYVLPRQFHDPAGWELQNMLQVARLMVHAAIEREESRGVHLRNDFPHPVEGWNRHLTVQHAVEAQ